MKSFLNFSIFWAFLVFATFSCDEKPEETDLGTEADFESFTFAGIDGSATITPDNGTITAKAQAATDLKEIVPIFGLSKKAKAFVGTTEQVSGTSKPDFSNPVTYTVISEDARNTKTWTVTINKDGGGTGITDLTSALINKVDAVILPGVYLCKNGLTLNSGNTLTFSAGVTVQFDAGAYISASNNATVKALGTATEPVTFTSSRSSKQPGDWQGIRVSQDGSQFEYCIFEYGSGDNSWDGGMLNLNDCKASVKNCTFRNAKYTRIYLYGGASGFSAFENNKINTCGETESGAYPIYADGGLGCLAGIGSGNEITTVKGIGVNGGNVVANTTLKALVVAYLFTNTPEVKANAVLTIEAGTTLKFVSDRGLKVAKDGKIVAKGASDKKITFTSAKLDAEKRAGDWYSVSISEGLESEFEYCVFEYGSGSDSWDWEGLLHLYNCKASVKNCTFANAKYSGIHLYDSDSGFSAFENNKISTCGETEAGAYPIKAGSSAGLGSLAGIGSGNEITTAKGIGVDGGTVSKSMTVKAFVPYLFYATPTINNAAVLTVEAEATLKFNSDKGIELKDGAKIIAKGNSTGKITFTSAKEGSNRKAGDWYSINIIESFGSEFEYCVFEYGSGTDDWYWEGMIRLYDCKASISNCTFNKARYSGIHLYNASSGFEKFENNTVSECGEDEAGAYPIKAGDFAGIMSLAGMGTGNTITTAKGIGINGGTVNKNMTLKKFPYTVYGNIDIESTSVAMKLTVEAGAELKFTQDRALTVKTGGILDAKGTSSDMITFTGSLPQKGHWKGIIFEKDCIDGNILEYCNVSYGARDNTWDHNGNISCLETSASQVTIKNCNLTNSKGWGIYFYYGATATMSGNTFSGNELGDTGNTYY